jgi:hypothetical protein
MSLRTRIQELRTYAEVANDEHQVRLRTGELSDLSDRLNVPPPGLHALKVGLTEIRQLEVETPASLDQDAVQVAGALHALATELPGMAIDSNLDLAKVQVRAAGKFAADLRGFVAEAWHRHVTQPLPPINQDLVDALDQGGVDVESIRTALESAEGILLAIVNRTIPLEGDADKFRTAFESLHTCGKEIGDVVDPDIAEGIVGAQQESGMPLAWFTTERLQTLAALGIIDRFRVRLQ